MGLAQIAESWTIGGGTGNTSPNGTVSPGGDRPQFPPLDCGGRPAGQGRSGSEAFPRSDNGKPMAFFSELKRRRVGK